MGQGADPLETLRCPKGCSPRFVQYLTWEGNSVRICNSYQVWLDVGVHETNYDIGLRCGDCGTQYGRKGIDDKTKQALDSLLERVSHELQDLVDQVDTELLGNELGGVALLMEDPEP